MNNRLICWIACIILLAAGPIHAAMRFFDVRMDGAQEAPSNAFTGTGRAVVALDDALNLLSWNITWTNLTSGPTAMHFHGPAGPGTNAAVQVNVGIISGLSSPSIGSTTISSSIASNFPAGLEYLNIHSATLPGGEIRGQVVLVPLAPNVALSGAEEVPATASPGTGSALVEFSSNVLTWHLSFGNLTGTVTAMHFHGPAGAGTNAAVQVNVGNISGLSSPLAGAAAITTTQAVDLLAGLWYFNIHSSMYPAGEIRGQVPPIPEPVLAAVAMVLALAAARRVKAKRN